MAAPSPISSRNSPDVCLWHRGRLRAGPGTAERVPVTLGLSPTLQMASATDSRYGQKESSDQNFDYMFKILIIGNSSVGKTSFLFRYADDSFTPAFVSTVGIDFKVKTIYRNDKRIKLQIWDTAGQERFRSITRAYYRNSVGGLLLFDITNRRSFQNVHEWLEETKVHVQPYQIVFVLVGHKCDLDTQRQVTRHEAEKLAAAYGMKYIETSARDAINVEKAFTDLTRDIYELVKRGDISIQEGWEGVKSGFVPNVVHSSEEVVKSDRRCLC